MKISRVFFTICIASAIAASAPGQAVKPAYSIVISANESAVYTGTPVFIQVKLKNISDKAVDCSNSYMNGTNVMYGYDIRDENGKSVEKASSAPRDSDR